MSISGEGEGGIDEGGVGVVDACDDASEEMGYGDHVGGVGEVVRIMWCRGRIVTVF